MRVHLIRSMSTRCVLGTLATGLAVECSSVAHAQVFTGVGVPGGAGSSFGAGLSADGTTVIGNTDRSEGPGNVAWKWRADSGLSELSTPGFVVTDVSADGQTTIGKAPGRQAIRWTASGTPELLPIWGDNPTSGDFWVRGPVVSRAGTSAAGCTSQWADNAAVWTAGSGGHTLFLPPSAPWTGTRTYSPVAITDDGLNAIGSYHRAYAYLDGTQVVVVHDWGTYRWNAGGGFSVQLGFGVSDATPSLAVLVGGSGDSTWRAVGSEDHVLLGMPPISQALSNVTARVSDDGNLVVSCMSVWTPSHGTQQLEQFLAQSGCDISGWSSLVVTDVSGSGQSLCGFGTNPLGITEAWYATVPAPSWSVLFASASLLACRRQRH